MSLCDVILIVSIILPVLVPLGAALYKHLVDMLPSNQRQAVVDTVRIATQAIAVNPAIAANAEAAATVVLKELHLPVNPAFIKSLVALFEQEAGGVASEMNDQGVSSSEVHSPVGFVTPPPAGSPAGPSLHQ